MKCYSFLKKVSILTFGIIDNSHILGDETRYLRKIADKLERHVKEGRYDVVIGVETPRSYVLTRDLGCMKIFSCESLWSEELRFSPKLVDSKRVQN